jgi:hypothetical protein
VRWQAAIPALVAIAILGFPWTSHAQGIWQELVNNQAAAERRATEQKVDRPRPPNNCGEDRFPCKKQLVENGWVVAFRGEDRSVIDGEYELSVLASGGRYKYCFASLYPDDRRQMPCSDLHPVSK